MKYLSWDEVHKNDVVYDTKYKENIQIDSKFYNVYARKMITATSDSCFHIIREFDENRYTEKREI